MSVAYLKSKCRIRVVRKEPKGVEKSAVEGSTRNEPSYVSACHGDHQ